MAHRRILLVVAALVVAACGGGSADTTTTTAAPATTTTAAAAETTTTTAATTTTTEAVAEDAGTKTAAVSPQLAAVRAALTESAEIQSGRVEGSMSITGDLAGDGTIAEFVIPFSTSFDAATGNSAFAMDLSAMSEFGGEEVPPEFGDLFGEMEFREIGDTTYIKFGFFGLMLGSETPWISAPAEEGDDLAGSFSFTTPTDPTEVFGDFGDADAEVTEVGRETVNGVETTHYIVVFDTEALRANMTPAELEELEENGPIPLTELPVDMWITDDGIVIRYIMDIDGSDVVAEEGEEFERMVIRFDLFDLGQPVEILPPDPSEVTPIEELGAGLFGLTPEG